MAQGHLHVRCKYENKCHLLGLLKLVSVPQSLLFHIALFHSSTRRCRIVFRSRKVSSPSQHNLMMPKKGVTFFLSILLPSLLVVSILHLVTSNLFSFRCLNHRALVVHRNTLELVYPWPHLHVQKSITKIDHQS